MGSAINLGASQKEISAAVKSMYTDPNHLKIEDAGCVEGNVVFTYLDAFHPDSNYITHLKEHYQRGGLGDGTTKKILEECLQELLRPIREKRAELLDDKAQLIDILVGGSQKNLKPSCRCMTSTNHRGNSRWRKVVEQGAKWRKYGSSILRT